MNTTKRLSVKNLSTNARIIKIALTKMDGKLYEAKQINAFVIKELNCSIRTAQRVIKELQASKKISEPKAYKITLKY